MYKKLQHKEAKLAVIGLGYVGLPIALEFAKKISVIGFDINEARIEMMKKAIDPSEELPAAAFENCDITFTASLDILKGARFFIIAVPTPIDEHNLPDLKPLLAASKTVGAVLKKGDYVVYESTVYPGCTEEDCIPVLEENSKLKFNKDFKVGYSPERINPGDEEHSITKIVKVVSGCDDESLETIANTYQLIVKAGVHKVSSIKIAEAAKIIENTQRDVNIALMNELSIIFNRMGINTYEVLEAAATKWNFMKFSPGLVGGHCIGVDPYYLTYKAEGLGYHILWVGLLMAGVTLGTQAWALQNGDTHWQTMVFTVLSLSQLGHVLAIRSDRVFLYKQGLFSNLPMLGAILLTFLLQLAVIYLPFANSVLKTQPLTFNELVICLAVSAIVFHAVELEKWIKYKLKVRNQVSL